MEAAIKTIDNTQALTSNCGEASNGLPRVDSIVTARVPKEIKRQGNNVLKKIGATPTDLVNAAFRYVIDHGELPRSYPSLEEVARRRRALSDDRKRALKERAEKMTLKAPPAWEGKSFDQLREGAMEDRYPDFFNR